MLLVYFTAVAFLSWTKHYVFVSRQTWFRVVPKMKPSVVKNVAAFLNADRISNGMVTTAVFVRACDASHVPLSQAECYMLAQLLTRRQQVPHNQQQQQQLGEGEAVEAPAFVDVAPLERIRAGDFLHAALA